MGRQRNDACAHARCNAAWLAAVDPRGGVLFAGAGMHGIIRMRMRRPDDVFVGDLSISKTDDQT